MNGRFARSVVFGGFTCALVSPLCMYIITQISENARWDIVQTKQELFIQEVKLVQINGNCVDIPAGL